jgi:hypothetical protein
MAKKKHDPQAKAKRQKIIVAVGGVILLGLLAFQLPRTLKLLHQSKRDRLGLPAGAGSDDAGRHAVGGASAATSGTAAATSVDGLTDPGTAVAPQSGQLLAFSRFPQQRTHSCSSSRWIARRPERRLQLRLRSHLHGSGWRLGGPREGSRRGRGLQATHAATLEADLGLISVNGTSEAVAVGAQFPAASPSSCWSR